MGFRPSRRLLLSSIVRHTALIALISGSAGCDRLRSPGGKAPAPGSPGGSPLTGRDTIKPDTSTVADGPPPERYAFVELQVTQGALYGDVRSEPHSVNAKGQVAGHLLGDSVANHPSMQACQWDINGTPTDLFLLLPAGVAQTDSDAWSINSAGVSVGYGPCNPADGCAQNLYRWESGRATEIKGPERSGKGGNPSTRFINDRGQIVAFFSDSGTVLIGADGVRQTAADLKQEWMQAGTPDPEFDSVFQINNQNQCLVDAMPEPGATNKRHSYLWDRTNRHAVSLPLSLPDGHTGGPIDLNDRGEVLLQASTDTSPSGSFISVLPSFHAYLWKAGKLTDLTALPASLFQKAASDSTENKTPDREPTVVTEAAALNNRGQVVGRCRDIVDESGAEARVFLWQEGTLYDLNRALPSDSGWVLREAMDISDAGHIVGIAQKGEQWSGFLLVPQA